MAASTTPNGDRKGNAVATETLPSSHSCLSGCLFCFLPCCRSSFLPSFHFFVCLPVCLQSVYSLSTAVGVSVSRCSCGAEHCRNSSIGIAQNKKKQQQYQHCLLEPSEPITGTFSFALRCLSDKIQTTG